jgi:phosphohistidine phosphatase SixA
MAALDAIAAELRRQRKDIDDLLESTASRSGETAELLVKIGELRRRAEETRRTFAAPEGAAVEPSGSALRRRTR